MAEARHIGHRAWKGSRALIQKNPFHYSIATRVRNPYFLKYLAPRPDDQVLDVGCGVGYFVDLLNSSASTWGMDPDLNAVKSATYMVGRRFLAARGEELPFRDNIFDKLLCSEVLEHVADDARAVSELHRVAKPGATVVITVPCIEGIFGTKIKSICHEGENPDSWERHQRAGYTTISLKALLERCDIEVQKEQYTMVFLTELLMGITKLTYSIASGEKQLDSQARVLQVSKSPLLKLYRIMFPFFLLLARLEDFFLAPVLRGHMLVVKAVIRK